MKTEEIVQKDNNFKNFLKEIKQNCTRIINVYNKTDLFLFRGSKKFRLYYSFEPQIERNPRNTSKEVHDLIDIIFKEAKIEVNRKNCIFCTSDKNFAAVFGKVYMIFPSDDFKFVWSPFINDFSAEQEKIFNSTDFDSDKNIFIFKETRQGYENFYSKTLGVFTLKNEQEAIKNLLTILKNRYPSLNFNGIRNLFDLKHKHVSIFNNIFYGFDEKINSKIKAWIKEYAISIEDSKDFLNYMARKVRNMYYENDIEGALKSQNEIMMKARKFYAISEELKDSVKDFIKKHI
ncbi:MAG: hypothetical protein NZZ41_00725 [Candidatus Dojkabacteria bacterium]|nr:hypothetical protein [Candidatus Dojkabacteria bacterium]